MITVGRWKWSWSSHRFLKWAKFFGAMVDLQMYPICLVKGLPPPFIPLFAMNIFHDFSIFLWNIRVALGCCTKCHCRHLIKSYKPSLLMLYETHVAFSKVEIFWKSLGYSSLFILEAQGHSRGIWILTIRMDVNFSLVDSMPQSITFVIKKLTCHWYCTSVYTSPTTNCA